MKLLLCGGGCGEQTVLANQRFGAMIDKKKPLLYVPLAMQKENYPSCFEWIKGELANLNVPSIEMVTTAEELSDKVLSYYCAIFIGGGNTYKLLAELKASGGFDTIKEFIKNDGIVFGGSAGAIIFGEDINTCKYADKNDVNLSDTKGFDVLNGISLLCHYTNESEEKTQIHREYLLELSKDRKIIALPEEDTLVIDGEKVEIIGTRPYYEFENGNVVQKEI